MHPHIHTHTHTLPLEHTQNTYSRPYAHTETNQAERQWAAEKEAYGGVRGEGELRWNTKAQERRRLKPDKTPYI